MPNKPPTNTGFLKGKTAGVGHKWWLFGGLGLGGAYYLYRRNHNTATTADAPADPTADPNATTDPYTGYDSAYGSGAGGAYGSYGGSIPAQSDPALAQAQADQATALDNQATALEDIAGAIDDNVPQPAETNQQWMHAAIAALEKNGYTKAAATAAVTAYLAGAPMTQKQLHTVESAIGHVGTPPQRAPGIHLTHPPKPTRKDAREPVHKQARRHHHHKAAEPRRMTVQARRTRFGAFTRR